MSRLYFILFLLLAQNILKAQTDTIPPSIFCPISDTVTLPAGGVCSFQYFYVVASSDELPGDTLVQLAGLPSGADFPLGNTVNIFQAIDAAGNTATCSFTLTVQNYVGPLVCKTNLSVSLDSTCAWTATAADLLTGAAGCTDSAYYLLEVDKTPPYGNGPWVAADFGQVDIGKTYVFRVSDTIYGYECQGSVQINDMLPPVLTCQDITISCAVDNVSPAFLKDSLGIAQAVPIVEDACDASPVFNFIDTETAQDCGSGFAKIINRKWTAQDGFGNSSTCVQQISLTRPTLADLRYPRDTTLAYCINADIPTTTTGLPYLEFAGKKFTNLCSLGATFSDSTIQISPCDKQILRTWFAVDWCNGSTLDTVQVIDVQDTVAVVFLNCPDSTLTLGDTTATNDPSLWNAPHWANPQTGMENLCEGQADLQIAALDACTNTHIRYLLFLDLDNNGTPETVVNSDNPPAPGTVNFGNAANPNYAGGESRSFDERAVDSILKYRFALQTIASGDTLTTRVVWNSDSLPSQFATPQLPHGTHKIKWIAQDSCGNESVCEYNFTIKDSRAPAVTCSSGLTVNFPPNQTCMLTIYAIDFLQEAEDNCTPPANLMFAVRRAGAGAGFPVDSSGNPNASITFVNPYDLGPQSVELWVKDLAGNAGFCTTSIDLQDPIGSCDPSFDLDAVGNVKTEFDTPVANATIAMAISTTSMNITLQTQTNQQGQFVFASSVPLGGNYTLTPSKNNNHLDGVTTFDLALISKHILGLETLSSPYKLIAADANKSNSVTTFDIVELRKLILGIYANLPQNTSWRFVDKILSFPIQKTPS